MKKTCCDNCKKDIVDSKFRKVKISTWYCGDVGAEEFPEDSKACKDIAGDMVKWEELWHALEKRIEDAGITRGQTRRGTLELCIPCFDKSLGGVWDMLHE